MNISCFYGFLCRRWLYLVLKKFTHIHMFFKITNLIKSSKGTRRRMIQLKMCSEAPLDAPNISHSGGLALEASFLFFVFLFPFYPPFSQSQTTITLHIHQHIVMGGCYWTCKDYNCKPWAISLLGAIHSFNRFVCIRIRSRIFRC